MDEMPCYLASMAPSTYNPNLRSQTTSLPDLEPLKSASLQLLGRQVLDCTPLGHGFYNVVYELKMADGGRLAARITYNFKTDKVSGQWLQDRLSREIFVLKFLKLMDRELPVPQVYAWDLDVNNSIQAPFSIMERLYDEDQWSAWPKLTFEEKIKFVQSLAEAMGRIFKITMPSIGSLEKLTNHNVPIVGPLIRCPPDPRNGGPYATIDEYLDAELETPLKPRFRSQRVLLVSGLFQNLRALARRLVPRDDPAMLRPVLVHNELDARNFLVKDGVVSGIIGWEFHSVLPACLGACYPPFMRLDGIYDPKYNIHKESLLTASEVGPLRSAFREAAEKISTDYVRALDRGEDLRRLLEFSNYAVDVCYDWLRDMSNSLSI